MACPGSIRLSAGRERASSSYADEGTAAHQVAEKCLRAERDAAEYVGTKEVVNGAEWEVTEEMAEAVQVFLDEVRAACEPGDTLLIEHQFDLSAIRPDMFGTNDACVVNPRKRVLHVFDYKHGKGHAVEVIGNPQLRYYGLGALLDVGATGIDKIVLTIVQPRAPHRDGPVRRETISVLELVEWINDLRAAAQRTEDPDAPLVPGDHCTFCPAAGVCRALHDKALDSAMADFSGAAITVPDKRHAETLTPSDLARVLDAADMIDEWLAAVRAHALHLADSGTGVPGYKIVPKRATRKWICPEQVPQALSALGVPAMEMYAEPKLRSPAQIETVLPKSLGQNAKARAAKLEPLVSRVSSGVNLVRDSDARAGIEPSAIADFRDII